MRCKTFSLLRVLFQILRVYKFSTGSIGKNANTLQYCNQLYYAYEFTVPVAGGMYKLFETA